MSKCPFWSTAMEKIECYSECPILGNELLQGENSERCIFNECTEASTIDFKDSIKEEYSFLNLSMYDEEKCLKVNY